MARTMPHEWLVGECVDEILPSERLSIVPEIRCADKYVPSRPVSNAKVIILARCRIQVNPTYRFGVKLDESISCAVAPSAAAPIV